MSRELRYENDKFLPGEKNIRVVIMFPGERLDRLLQMNDVLRCDHQGMFRIVFSEHGGPDGRSDVEHTSQHFTDLLKFCADNGVSNLTISDSSCYGAATCQLHSAQVPLGMKIVHRQCRWTCSLFDLLGGDTKGQTRIVHRWADRYGAPHQRDKYVYENGSWVMGAFS